MRLIVIQQPFKVFCVISERSRNMLSAGLKKNGVYVFYLFFLALGAGKNRLLFFFAFRN